MRKKVKNVPPNSKKKKFLNLKLIQNMAQKFQKPAGRKRKKNYAIIQWITN